jgi:hypothetical protein
VRRTEESSGVGALEPTAPPASATRDAELASKKQAREVVTASRAQTDGLRVSATHDDGTRRLTIDLPAAERRSGTAEVRIQDASGTRELRQRIEVVDGAPALELDLPASWLGASSYAVEVVRDGRVVVRGAVAAR